ADPTAMRRLTVWAGAMATRESDPEGEVLAYFGGRLGDVAPAETLIPISTTEGIVETIAILIRGYLQANTIEKLAELGPELVCLALMPYLGLEGARKWAATFSPVGASGKLKY